MNEIIIVGFVGLVVNTILFYLVSEVRFLFRNAVRNREVMFYLLSILILLGWPVSENAAFGGEQLGLIRAVRILLFLGIFGLLITKRYLVSSMYRLPFLYFSLYILICGFSVFISPNPLETLWKTFEILVLLMIALRIYRLCARELTSLQQVLSIIVSYSIVSVVNAIVGGILFPELAYGASEYVSSFQNWSMGGIFPQVNANSLAQYSAMIFIYSFLLFTIRGRLTIAVLVIMFVSLVGLYLSYSRTSLLAVAFIVLVIFPFKGSARSLPILVSGVLVCIFVFPAVLEYLSRGQTDELFFSLSGRTRIWLIGWNSFVQNPFFGIGYYSGHKTLNIDIAAEVSSLDSTYVEALVDVGIAGTLPLILFVISLLVLAFRALFVARNLPPQNAFWLVLLSAFILLFFIRSLSGPSFQVLHQNLFFVLNLVAAGLIWLSSNRSGYGRK